MVSMVACASFVRNSSATCSSQSAISCSFVMGSLFESEIHGSLGVLPHQLHGPGFAGVRNQLHGERLDGRGNGFHGHLRATEVLGCIVVEMELPGLAIDD